MDDEEVWNECYRPLLSYWNVTHVVFDDINGDVLSSTLAMAQSLLAHARDIQSIKLTFIFSHHAIYIGKSSLRMKILDEVMLSQLSSFQKNINIVIGDWSTIGYLHEFFNNDLLTKLCSNIPYGGRVTRKKYPSLASSNASTLYEHSNIVATPRLPLLDEHRLFVVENLKCSVILDATVRHNLNRYAIKVDVLQHANVSNNALVRSYLGVLFDPCCQSALTLRQFQTHGLIVFAPSMGFANKICCPNVGATKQKCGNSLRNAELYSEGDKSYFTYFYRNYEELDASVGKLFDENKNNDANYYATKRIGQRTFFNEFNNLVSKKWTKII